MAKTSTSVKSKQSKGTSQKWDAGRKLANVRKPRFRHPLCKFPDCFHCVLSDCKSD